MTPDPTPFNTLLSWLQTCQTDAGPPPPEDHTSLFQHLERELDVDVPEDLKHYFRLLNPYLAQQEQGLFYGLTAIPLQYALGEREEWLSGVIIDPSSPLVTAVDPPGTVRPVAFDAGWLPLAHDHSGAYLAADLRPGVGGHIVQIINFGSRELKRFVLAASISEFFADLLRNIADGRVEQTCEAGAVSLEAGKDVIQEWA